MGSIERHGFFAGNVRSLAAAAILVAASAISASAAEDPFADVIGKWSGSGLMTIDDNKERIACDADHSGNASQLRLIINCVSGPRDIRMVAHLSSNDGRLLGYWEETKYLHLAGAISGVASPNKISFKVTGIVNVTMVVSYSKTRQRIAITAKDVPLQSLTIDMRRR